MKAVGPGVGAGTAARGAGVARGRSCRAESRGLRPRRVGRPAKRTPSASVSRESSEVRREPSGSAFSEGDPRVRENTGAPRFARRLPPIPVRTCSCRAGRWPAPPVVANSGSGRFHETGTVEVTVSVLS